MELKKKQNRKELDSIVISSDEFSIIVEERAIRENISCFNVLMNMIETDEVGIDNIPTLLSDRLKMKLELDAKKLNLLKKDIQQKKTLI